MLDFKIVNNYSCVLLALYKDHKEVAGEAVGLFAKLNGDLVGLNILYNRLCPMTDKIKVLSKYGILQYTKEFFELVVKNNRSEYILHIIKSFCERYDDFESVGRVKLCVASDISQQHRESIINLLKSKFGFLHVYLDVIIDKKLIGGCVIYVNDHKCDCSIKNSLNKLSKKFNTNK
ncbi:MAG: F0F1 ATP synthase subunit delta [Cytophagales bacterium]|nr:F0F1 ATP synthase subunit delta [Cytophagales bacterium]